MQQLRQGRPRADRRTDTRRASVLPEAADLKVLDITERAAIVSGLAAEQPRYTRSASRYTTSATRVTPAGLVARTPDGRNTPMTDWTSLSYVVVDVEGNGQQPPDLVELATVPIIGGNIGEPMTWLVRPDQPITHFARKIHGITNDDVQDAPVFGSVEADVRKALHAAALIAHNAHVDVGVLQRRLGHWQHPEVFDTLKLARRLLRAPAKSRQLSRRSLMGWSGFQAWCRRAWAMLVLPLSRSMLMARLRRDAMTRGALPVRIWERSSS